MRPTKRAIKKGNLARLDIKSSLLILSSSSTSNVLNSFSICKEQRQVSQNCKDVGKYELQRTDGGDLPHHQLAAALSTVAHRIAAPCRYKMFQYPCTSQKQFHRCSETTAVSLGGHTQSRTAHITLSVSCSTSAR